VLEATPEELDLSTWPAFAVVLGRAAFFDTAHTLGNVVLALAVGPELRRVLHRFARRLKTEVVDVRWIACALTALLLPAPAQASPIGRAVSSA
jgi:hypothetical protein